MKRLKDCDRWTDPWFFALPGWAKLCWDYMTDTCDHAGVYKVNIKMLAIISDKLDLTRAELDEMFGDRLVPVDPETVWIPKYILFHYGWPLGDNNCMRSAQAIMDREGLDITPYLPPGLKGSPTHGEGTPKGSPTLQKEKEQEKEKKGEKENKPRVPQPLANPTPTLDQGFPKGSIDWDDPGMDGHTKIRACAATLWEPWTTAKFRETAIESTPHYGKKDIDPLIEVVIKTQGDVSQIQERIPIYFKKTTWFDHQDKIHQNIVKQKFPTWGFNHVYDLLTPEKANDGAATVELVHCDHIDGTTFVWRKGVDPEPDWSKVVSRSDDDDFVTPEAEKPTKDHSQAADIKNMAETLGKKLRV